MIFVYTCILYGKAEGVNHSTDSPHKSCSLYESKTGQGTRDTGQCPTHFSQATSETRLFCRTLTCPLYRSYLSLNLS